MLSALGHDGSARCRRSVRLAARRDFQEPTRMMVPRYCACNTLPRPAHQSISHHSFHRMLSALGHGGSARWRRSVRLGARRDFQEPTRMMVPRYCAWHGMPRPGLQVISRHSLRTCNLLVAERGRSAIRGPYKGRCWRCHALEHALGVVLHGLTAWLVNGFPPLFQSPVQLVKSECQIAVGSGHVRRRYWAQRKTQQRSRLVHNTEGIARASRWSRAHVLWSDQLLVSLIIN